MIRVITFRPSEKNISLQHNCEEIINIPLVKVKKLHKVGDLNLDEYDGIAFTSSLGVKCFLESYGKIPEYKKIYAIGRSTENELKKNSYHAILPQTPDSHSLALWIAKNGSKNVLIPRGKVHSEVLQEVLRLNHVTSKNLYLYDYEVLDRADSIGEKISDSSHTVLLFTSSLEVKIFTEETCGKYLDVSCFPVGNPTLKTLRDLGYSRIRETEGHNIEEILEIICKNSGEWI